MFCNKGTLDHNESMASDQEDHLSSLSDDCDPSGETIEEEEPSILQASTTTEYPESATEEQGCSQDFSTQHAVPKKKRDYRKRYDKYQICHAYLLFKFFKIKARDVSSKTGINESLIYSICSHRSLLYSDYIDEIKDMSKEELEQFLRELQNPQ